MNAPARSSRASSASEPPTSGAAAASSPAQPRPSRPRASRPHGSRPTWRVSSESPPPERIGPYKIFYKLASGGTSSVYIGAREDAPGAAFAVKVLDKIGRDERGLLTFLAEARVTTALDHDNVVRTVDWGEYDGEPFLAMELVLGASLSELIAAQKRHDRQMDPWLVAAIVEKAARGLHHAHELRDDAGKPLQLVHRDISPQNILISFDGRVALSDFGIAKFSNRGLTTAKGLLKGRFAYMSPEHANGHTLDRRSDIFSLGIVLFEALTLQRAFEGKSAGDAILQLLHMDRVDPGALRPDVPAVLSQIVAKAAARDQDQRYATALEMADALASAREGAEASAPAATVGALVATHFTPRKTHLESTLEAEGLDHSRPLQRAARHVGSTRPAPKTHGALIALAALAALLLTIALVWFAR